MTTHLFSHSVRVLLCVACGAPLQLDLAAASSPCSYCGAVNVLAERDDSPLVPGPEIQPVDDAQRLTRLRMQVGKPLLPPPSLRELVPHGRIEPWKVQEVFAVWQATREETRLSRGYDPAERLLYLTMVLANHYSQSSDLLRQRAMFESALAVFTLPRHRQILRGYLSRASTREGDFAAAEAWLAPCDTRSDDLHTDSAWRISRAYLDTARSDWPAVLAALGADPEAVPIDDTSDALAILLRANALEQQGDVARATDQLRRAMGRGVAMRGALGTILGVHSEWKLCRRSYERADAGYTAEAARSAGGPLGGIGSIFFWIGVLMLVGSLVALGLTVVFGLGTLLGAIPQLVRVRPNVAAELTAAAGVCGTLAFTGLVALPTTLPIGITFTAVGYGFRRSAKRARRLRLHGVRGTAQVLGMEATGMSVNDVPQMELALRVQLPDADPYEAKTRLLLAPHQAAQFAPGITVPVLVDPDDRKEVILETD